MQSLALISSGLLLIFVQGWITWYLTYFKKKGEYQAMKEEIDQITKATETIKSELNFLTQKEISLDVLKRNAILEFNDALHLAIHDLTFRVSIIKDETIAEYHNGSYSKYILARGRLRLFVNDEHLHDLLTEITNYLEGIMVAVDNMNSEYNGTGKWSNKDSQNFDKNYSAITECQEKLTITLKSLL